MITRTKMKQLEEKCARISNKNDIIIRYVNVDHKLVDKDNNLLSEVEVKRIAVEDKENRKNGSIVIHFMRYGEPKSMGA